MVKDNNYLGKFTLRGLPRTLRGVPKIEVTFNIDSNGILTIQAEDKKHHLSGKIQIENEKGRLSQREIERMLADAETYQDQDSLTRAEIVAKESLRGYIVRLRKAILDLDPAKVSDKERYAIEMKMNEAEQWLQKGGLAKEQVQDKQKQLENVWNAIMIRVNQASGDFWDEALGQGGEKLVLVEDGGYHLANGFDLRELFEDPD